MSLSLAPRNLPSLDCAAACAPWLVANPWESSQVLLTGAEGGLSWLELALGESGQFPVWAACHGPFVLVGLILLVEKLGSESRVLYHGPTTPALFKILF